MSDAVPLRASSAPTEEGAHSAWPEWRRRSGDASPAAAAAPERPATAPAPRLPGPPGLICSYVVQGGVRREDCNGFATALGVRSLRRAGLPVPAAMLDALAQCRDEEGGGFGFWPARLRPQWAPALPGDADDTALMTLELLHAGRLSRVQARRIACRSIASRRVARFPDLHPPWLRPGVFATWNRAGRSRDLIDCTATANVLALLAALELAHLPGVAEATTMLDAALRWAGEDGLRAASLSPFYPDPAEFVLALANAAESGASGLSALHRQAAATAWGAGAEARSACPAHPVCSSPYGAAVWRSPELARLRAWAQAMRVPRPPAATCAAQDDAGR